jgi:hypothetical protein
MFEVKDKKPRQIDNLYSCGGVNGGEPCPHFFGTQFDDKHEPLAGECRKNPPTAQVVGMVQAQKVAAIGQTDTPAPEFQVIPVTPPVAAEYWCGAHPVAVADKCLDMLNDIGPEILEMVRNLLRDPYAEPNKPR